MKIKDINAPLYEFKFEYFDKDGNGRFEVCDFNELMPKETALKIIYKHIGEFERSRLVYFKEKSTGRVLPPKGEQLE